MNDADDSSAQDGRLTVVLCLLFGLLLFDFFKVYTGAFAVPRQEDGLCQLLHYVPPDSLAITTCSPAEDKGSTRVSARCSPFLFTAMPINEATRDMLMTVDGIGPALADDILAYRLRHGPFTTSGDLRNLPGIGPKREKKFAAAFAFTEVQ